MRIDVNRRSFLQGVGGTAALTFFGGVAPFDASAASAATSFPSNPFTLGVASGDPLPGGVVLWTRLAPDPLSADGGLPGAGNLLVRYEVATDVAMHHVVKRGHAVAPVDLAHSVHVDVRGLEPDREYWYRFAAGGYMTEPARTRTAPARHAPVGELRWAYCTCQDYSHGFYTAYKHMAEEDLAVVFHLGDYIYEYGLETTGARGGDLPDTYLPEAATLDRYRLQYGLYKTDPDLQAAHARFPFVVTWDDHEVENDYTGDIDENGSPPEVFHARRSAAYQAYYEHQPLRAVTRPDRDGNMQLFRSLNWGTLAEFLVVDTRQYRSDHPCGDGEKVRCDASYDPAQTMLGPRQERWLENRVRGGNPTWTLVANQVMLAELDHNADEPDIHWQDSWDGYPVARNRFLQSLQDAGVRNTFVATGDWHSTFVNDIHLDFEAETSAVVATEIIAPAITSNGDGAVYGPYYGPMIPFNPHIKFFDGDRKGYVRCTTTGTELRADLRYVDFVGSPGADIQTYASFVVEDGVPGAQPA